MKVEGEIGKYTYYAKKRVTVFFHGFALSRLRGRVHGPKILLNSIPKSGTHLLETLFLNLPVVRHNGGRTIMGNAHDGSALYAIKSIEKLKNGQFAPSHIQYTDEIKLSLRDRNVKMLQMIRDPRDILVSHVNYISGVDKSHRCYSYISSLGSYEDRLLAVLFGVPGIIEPFRDVCFKFLPWVSDECVLTIKFEDLIGAEGGGAASRQLEVISDILDYMELRVGGDVKERLANAVCDKKSSTFNKGLIGAWSDSFSDTVEALIEKEIGDLIRQLGYGN